MPIATAPVNLLTRRQTPPPAAMPLDAPPPVIDNPPLDTDLVPTDDGGLIVMQNDTTRPRNTKHDANLAVDMPDGDLGNLAQELLDGIEADIRSRSDWEAAFVRGIDLLGIKMEEATSDVTSGGTVSKVYDSMIIEACVRYQSNFRAEMLPANGPVKVRDDKPTDRPKPQMNPAMPPPMGHNGGPPMPGAAGGPPPQMGAAPPPPPGPPGLGGAPPQQPGLAMAPPQPPPESKWPNRADLAEAFEMDFNHYLTVVDKNFYPDTDRMSFSQALHGCAFKKIYRCPIRRRPVSIFVMANDLIVSNDASSLDDAIRVSHRIIMSKATMARMKFADVYRDVDLQQPMMTPLPSEMAIKSVEGIKPTPERPQDQEYTIYECYVDLDLPGYEHKKGGKKTGLPLPYRVTIDKDSREILEIRRNWEEKDKDFHKKRRFVKYPFLPGLGFYDYGFVHILGNTARALTAIERILIDAGMFNCFPGGLIAKGASRQETNQIRMGPGGWKTIDTGGMPINQVVMALPYKEPPATLMALGQALSENGRRLAMTAEVQVGEGRADVPVGTTIALIEQSTKVMSSVHKRNHTAQQEEFEIMRELFVEEPEALWAFAKSPSRKWEMGEEFSDLLLVPSSDPNVPSHVHRVMIAQGLAQVAQVTPPGILDNRKVTERILRVIGVEDYQDLFMPPQPPQAAPPDPKAMSDAANMRLKQMDAQSKQQNAVLDGQIRMKEIEAENQNAAAERDIKMKTAQMNYAEEVLRQQSNARLADMKRQTDVHLAHAGHLADIMKEHAKPKPVAKGKDK